MSGSPVRNKSNSPIRNLDGSPKKLDVILEQEQHQNRMRRINLLSRDSVLGSAVRGRPDIANISNFSSVYETQRLKAELLNRDQQIQALNRQNRLINQTHIKVEEHLRLENDTLKRQIALLSRQSVMDIDSLKQKYAHMLADDENLVRKNYNDDVRRLLNDLQISKQLINEKEREIQHLNGLNHKNGQEYTANLENLIAENNILRNEIKYCEINKDNQVRQASTKRELQKSRTKGIISFCKQNTYFMQKQLTKLAQQLLQKNISIESFTKQLMKQKRNQEAAQRRYDQQLNKLQDQHSQQIKQRDDAFHKMQKHLKQEVVDLKASQMQLLQKIATLQHQRQTLKRDCEHIRSALQQKEDQINDLKENVNRLHDQHARQISKVMTDSRVKRKSLRNLSSSVSSLKDLSYTDLNAAGLKSGNLQRKESLGMGLQKEDSSPLPTVREQLARSSLMGGTNTIDENDQDLEIKNLVFHYEGMVQQLKRNKIMELQIANQTISKLKNNLQEKQQQILDVLSRFSPLMEFKLNQPSLEQQRKQKIKDHYKADIDILSVMLDKYQIAALRKYK